MEPFVIGINHRTSSVELRERLAMSHEQASALIKELVAAGVVAEGLVVSTCNRVEFYGYAKQPVAAMDAVAQRLSELKHTAPAELTPSLYRELGIDAVAHLFNVTASLDSLVVGEPQILGQVKDAYAAAQEAANTGPGLNRLMHRAFAVAKRVRTETKISRLAVSVSSVAVDLAKKIFGGLENHTAMLVGAGEMAELAAKHFEGAGIKELFILNRTYERAAALAGEFGATAVPFDKLHAYLAEVDIVVFSAAAPHHLLKQGDMDAIMRQRRQRPLFLIDIAVPRNVDGSVGEVDNVFLYDVDDLQQVADGNRALRQNETETAKGIVADETQKFSEWTRAQKAFPVIARLTARADALRKAELERTIADLGLAGSPQTVEKLDRMTSALVNKLLHGAIQTIKDAQAGDDAETIETVRRMFHLEDDAPAAAEDGQRKKA
jgi:glutamyl-tRNA reductase